MKTARLELNWNELNILACGLESHIVTATHTMEHNPSAYDSLSRDEFVGCMDDAKRLLKKLRDAQKGLA